MKWNHIAVVLRGHVRTWHFIYPLVFKFYESIAENVDYYFITWDTSNTNGIEETFEGKNLIHFQVAPNNFSNGGMGDDGDDGQFYNGWTGPAFMQTLLMPHIKIQEKRLGKKYDAFFDTRPDVLPQRQKILYGKHTGKELSCILPEQDSIYVLGIEIHKNQSPFDPRGGQPDVAIKDWLIMSRGKELEIMARRYSPNEFIYEPNQQPGSQIEYREIAEGYGITICTIDWMVATVVRPNAFELDWNKRNNWEAIDLESKKWPHLDKDTKIAVCENYGIAVSDYTDTHSITCKI